MHQCLLGFRICKKTRSIKLRADFEGGEGGYGYTLHFLEILFFIFGALVGFCPQSISLKTLLAFLKGETPFVNIINFCYFQP